MDQDMTAIVERIRTEYPGCFACGTDNPKGLHLEKAALDGDEAVTVFRPGDEHVGAGRSLHGGLAATLLDEIMVWAGILVHRVLTVTGTLDLRFSRPVTVDDEIVVRGRVDERRGKRLICSGSLEVAGSASVTGSGLYLVARTFESSGTTL